MEREYIGVDLHKQFFQACAVTATGARHWEGRFPRTDAGITLLCARCRAATAIAVEATGPTWAFAPARATVSPSMRRSWSPDIERRTRSTSPA